LVLTGEATSPPDVFFLGRSTDNGQVFNFTPIGFTQIDIGRPVDMRFPTRNVGYIVTNNQELLKTTDAGATWNIIRTSFPGGVLVEFSDSGKMEWIDENIGFISYVAVTDRDDGGGVMRTTDGGINWTVGTNLPQLGAGSFGIGPRGMVAFDSNNVVISIDRALWRSTDAGQTYTRVLVGGFGRVIQMERVSSTEGYALDSSGSVFNPVRTYRTTDAGATWSLVNSSTDSGIRGADIGDFVLGSNGVGVFHTTNESFGIENLFRVTDEGATIVNVGASSGADLGGFHADSTILDENRFIVVNSISSSQTNIHFTTDGGVTWNVSQENVII
jgi:photosystem II stability/assembly factor-like uncharacterized protein